MDLSFTAEEEACRELKEMSGMDQAGIAKSASTTFLSGDPIRSVLTTSRAYVGRTLPFNSWENGS